MDNQTKEIFKAIDSLVDASRDEKEALKEIFDIEGFGGAEWYCINSDDYRELAVRKLAWLRDQRAEGLRW
jgi:hypothetical protein